jgi:uncharacterized protein YxeA
MKKILFAITTIALVAGIVFATTSDKEQSNIYIVKKDSEQLYARMGDPGGGMG